MSTSAPNPGKAALVVAASNPFAFAKEASAVGGVGVSTSAPKPDSAAFVAAASNPVVVATEASASGGVEGGHLVAEPNYRRLRGVDGTASCGNPSR